MAVPSAGSRRIGQREPVAVDVGVVRRAGMLIITPVVAVASSSLSATGPWFSVTVIATVPSAVPPA